MSNLRTLAERLANRPNRIRARVAAARETYESALEALGEYVASQPGVALCDMEDYDDRAAEVAHLFYLVRFWERAEDALVDRAWSRYNASIDTPYVEDTRLPSGHGSATFYRVVRSVEVPVRYCEPDGSTGIDWETGSYSSRDYATLGQAEDAVIALSAAWDAVSEDEGEATCDVYVTCHSADGSVSILDI